MRLVFAVLVCLFFIPTVPDASGQSGGFASLMNGIPSASAETGPVPSRSTSVHVTESVLVRADGAETEQEQSSSSHVTGQQVLSAAGTFGDFTRYLQVLPGVAGHGDLSNEVLVRGGHPTENLFVVNGIEVPNINHFSLSGSTGGFTSMIDSSTVGSVDLHADGYDASFSSRLSSLIEIHTLPASERRRSGELTLGIAGAGGFYQGNFGRNLNILLSGHRSVVNLITNDVGINGVPTYTNGLVQLDWTPGSIDHVSVLSLSGSDSIHEDPCAGDAVESSDVETQYAGWRTTDGMIWDHAFSPHLISKLTVSNSTTKQAIGQQQQTGNINVSCHAASLLQVYTENSLENLTSLHYQVQRTFHQWTLAGGAGVKLTSLHDVVQQPSGEQSPFSSDSAASDAIQVDRLFSAGETDVFVEAAGDLERRWRVEAGLRVEDFGLDGRSAFDPHITLTRSLNAQRSVYFSWANASQLPPTMDMLIYTGNHLLRPAEVQLEAAGVRLAQTPWGTFDMSVYNKRYEHAAVSSEYPQLALNSMIDTLGQQFLWLPLLSKGNADAHGVELSAHAHWHNQLHVFSSATYARSSYRALDGIQRRSNFDVPLSISVMAEVTLPHGFSLNMRESATSGRLYTPFNLAASLAQDRGIYDLSRLNRLRGPMYARLDPELRKQMRIHDGVLDIQGGVENLFDRRNLLGYVWAKNCEASGECGPDGGPVVRVPQIGLYPSFSARYQF